MCCDTLTFCLVKTLLRLRERPYILTRDKLYGMKEGVCMFRRIIIATDLSSAAFAVIKNMSELKLLGTEEILLVQCINQVEFDSETLAYTTAVLEKSLQEQRKILEEQGFRVETRITPGNPKKEISRIAEEENYSLIVAGAESRTLISQALIGGIGYELMNYCRKPMLMVRLEEIRTEGFFHIQTARPDFSEHVMFPTDFSRTADKAFEVVRQLVRTGAKRVTLMHVQDQTHLDPYLMNRLTEFNNIDDARLAAMKETLKSDGSVVVDSVLTFGHPAKDIINAINERQVQLVVMGSQGRGYVKELFLGSVSNNIVRHSEASVLLIPPLKEEN